MDRDEDPPAASGLLPRDFQRNKDVFITRRARMLPSLSINAFRRRAICNTIFFPRPVFAYRTPELLRRGEDRGTDHNQAIAPCFSGCGPLFCAGGTCFSDCPAVHLPVTPGRIRMSLHSPDRSITRRSLNDATGAGANSCGFTFCARVGIPCARFADQTAHRAPI